jgi:hypothetical protein
MNEIPSEKVSFRKQDIVALHSLPSAQAHDPCIVHAPSGHGRFWGMCRGMAYLVVIATVLCAGLLVAIESGALDAPLNARAQKALNAALGDTYHAEVESTVLRLTMNGSLALKAQNVTLVENLSNKRLVTTESVSIELDALALLTGRIAVSRLEADGAMLDPALLPQGRPIDLGALRIAKVGDGLEAVFEQIDRISKLIARSNTQVVRLSDLKLSFAGPRARIIPVVVEKLDFNRVGDGSMQISGLIQVDGKATELTLEAASRDGRIASLSGSGLGIPLTPFLYRPLSGTEMAFGLVSSSDLKISAVRAGAGITPAMQITAQTGEGHFHAGGFTSDLKKSEIVLAYDFGRRSIEILPSAVNFGRSSFPFTGAVSDIEKSSEKASSGFTLDLLLQSASAAPVDVGDRPLIFDAKAHGRFLTGSHELLFDELTVSSAMGSLAGSLSLTFGDSSPQISFAALTDRVQSAAVKQLWPWWVGKTARRWVIANIYGGTVTNAKLEVFLPKGRISRTVGPLQLNDRELNVSFDIEDARINLAGDIPPLRDASGRFTLKGEQMDVEIKGGTAYFPSDRSVSLSGGNFQIPNVHEKPLMAEMKIAVAGEADAIAELVSYRPIRALQRTSFKAEDFSGPMTAQVGARFGLVTAQNPPPPQWQTEMVLNGVTLNKQIAGRDISDIAGTLRVDENQAVLDARAAIDGMPMDLSVVEPVGSTGNVKRKREISGTLNGDAIRKIAPGLAGIVDGTVGVDLSIDETEKQTVSVDLDRASISLPWVGWSKGPGIGATAKFSTATTGGVTRIEDFAFSGDGFGAKGQMQIDKDGLNTARFTSVRLAAADNYSVSVARQKGGYSMAIDGVSADVRPVLELLRSPSESAKSGGGGKSVAIEARLDKVQGFQNETLSGVNFIYKVRGREINGLDLTAITDSGQAVVAKLSKAQDSTIELTSGDAGSLARFADIYSNMRGGLLNLKLRDRGAGSWRGAVDIRKFALVDEDRLKSMVSTPADDRGRSLNQAVKGDIDVSTARFERGFAELLLDPGSVRVDRGVVRGTDIGATFQGTIRDANGIMDMTGTFMPAYGLNRLFGELPLIGAILGNGRDRGLLGITFRLDGPYKKPRLTINPLSIIAPGVFRSIFEF